MNRRNVWIGWGVLAFLCAAAGLLRETQGLIKALQVLLAMAFFVPPALLLYGGEPGNIRAVRNLAAASLGSTLVMLVVNMLSVESSRVVGDVLYDVLAVVSVPMMCAQYWLVSMFVWAVLMITAMDLLKKKRNK